LSSSSDPLSVKPKDLPFPLLLVVVGFWRLSGTASKVHIIHLDLEKYSFGMKTAVVADIVMIIVRALRKMTRTKLVEV